MRHRSLMVFLMAMALAVMTAVQSYAAAPRIMVNPEVHDFGMVESGNKISALFTVVNAGDAELVISDLKPDCGCTAVVSGARSVPPAGRTEIEAVLDSAGLTGKVSRTVTMYTNDPQQPRKDLVIQGLLFEKIGGELQVTPHSLNTGNMAPGKSKLYTYELRNIGAADLVISQIETTAAVSLQITVPFTVNAGETRDLKFVLKPGEVAQMNVTVSPKVPEGKFQEMFTIYSNSVLRPAQRMVIRGTVVKQAGK